MGLCPELLRPELPELVWYQRRKAVVWSEVLNEVLSEVEAETDLGAAPFPLMKAIQRGRDRSVSREARRESSVAREPERVRPGLNVEGVDLHMHKDGDEPPQWARYVVESQLDSEARLVNLESEIRKATRGRKENDAKEYVFEKKLYRDQYDSNKNIFEHLNRALHLALEDSECGDLIREGINLLKNHNKQLKITDRFDWETAEAYRHDPFADNSSDEKRLKHARKEGKLAKEEKVKLAKSKKSVKKSFPPFLQRAFTAGTGFLPSCWRCHRTGHMARFCRVSIPGQGPFNNQFSGPKPGNASAFGAQGPP